MSTTLSKVFPVIFKGTTKEYPVVETPLDLTSTASLTCGIVVFSEPSVTRPFRGNGVTGSSDPIGPNVKLVELDLQTSIIYLLQIDYNLFIKRNLFYHI